MKHYYDKLLHACAGMIISAAMCTAGLLLLPRGEEPTAYGMGVAAAIVAGAAKELHDGWEKSDAWDFALTFVGGVAGALMVGLIALAV